MNRDGKASSSTNHTLNHNLDHMFQANYWNLFNVWAFLILTTSTACVTGTKMVWMLAR
jgi:hypothetical protein